VEKTRFLIRRWVAEKPGFLPSFSMKPQDCGKNPVSDSPLIAEKM
jgi:hypothetical protein